MRIIHFDKRNNEMKLEPESLEDLWYLTKVVEPGDKAIARSLRRFKIELERAESGEKKPVLIELNVESVEFSESMNKLRLTGKILAGTPEEYVSVGSHHTLDIEPHHSFTLKKEFGPYHLKVLEEAKRSARQPVIQLVVMDDEKATVCSLERRGLSPFIEIQSRARKRDPESYEEFRKKYFSELMKLVEEGKRKTIIAGPGFAKEDFKKYVAEKKPKLISNMIFEHVSSSERSGVYELLKKGVVERVFGEQKLEEEFIALEKLKKSIASEDGLACYGVDEVKNAVELNAVEEILVLDELLRKNKEAQELVEKAEKKGAKILVFDSGDEAGQEFKTYKLAALLRFRTSY
ncbi:mRNA surveillance protein pelota [Candidatus Micrarchaeota archaeon]|nr:mRNA surveillance protein pelota [Candidatus Micrarchaeota archaeon]